MRLYDLRHTAATLRLVNGEHPKVVQEMLGHASITLTMDTYSHVLPGMQEESAALLDEARAHRALRADRPSCKGLRSGLSDRSSCHKIEARLTTVRCDRVGRLIPEVDHRLPLLARRREGATDP